MTNWWARNKVKNLKNTWDAFECRWNVGAVNVGYRQVGNCCRQTSVAAGKIDVVRIRLERRSLDLVRVVFPRNQRLPLPAPDGGRGAAAAHCAPRQGHSRHWSALPHIPRMLRVDYGCSSLLSPSCFFLLLSHSRNLSFSRSPLETKTPHRRSSHHPSKTMVAVDRHSTVWCCYDIPQR